MGPVRWWRPRDSSVLARRFGPVLERGERVLVAAQLVGGGAAAATERALVTLGPGDAEDGVRRLAWHRVAEAGWDDERATLLVEEVGAGPAGPRTQRLRLAAPSLLPEAVRERVTASIVVSSHVPLRGRAGVRVVARRRPDAEELDWQLLFDPGLDPADPGVRARAEQALEQVRRQTT